MEILMSQVFGLLALTALCIASPTGTNQDATKTSGAAPSSISMASPESSLRGSSPVPAQMNMGLEGIEQIVAEAMKNSMGQGGFPTNTMGGMPTMAVQNTGRMPSLPAIPNMSAMPRLPMNNMMGMMNPMSMFSGSGSGSPFGMMRPMMMMNMMENLFEMIGF